MAIQKVLLVGEFGFSFYEPAFSTSLKKMGIEVIEFRLCVSSLFSFLYRLENYFSIIGPLTLYLYRQLNKIALNQKPQLIFFWRPTQINPQLLKSLKRSNSTALIVNYNNDNPFGKQYQIRSNKLKRIWKNFIKSIPEFDVNIVYRNSNIIDYDKVGSKKTLLFPPAFIPESIPNLNKIEFKYDVVFIGYAEEKRVNFLNVLISSGIKVKIYGTGWDVSDLHPSYLFSEILSVHGPDYFRCLKEGRINIAFLSVLNEDVYTRRNFEIPGMGGLMLSERTNELVTLFEEGKEAFYFSTEEELLNTVKKILLNPDLQSQVREAARMKSYGAGYDLDSRVKQLVSELNLLCE